MKYQVCTIKNLLDAGSCGLHVINGAFKDGSVKSRWPIQKLLLSLYRLLGGRVLFLPQDQISCHSHFVHRDGSEISVAEHVVEIWPHIK